MNKRIKIFVTAGSLAAVMALSTGAYALAATPDAETDNEVTCTQEGCGSGQGVCAAATRELLDLTPQEIQAQRQEGLSLSQIAAAAGVSEQELIDSITAERKAEIEAKVAAGTITQEQAEVMLQRMEQNILRAVTRTTVGHPEWAGNGGAGNAGEGTGLGQMKRNGQNSNGSGKNQGSGTGSGSMNRYGKAVR